MKSSTNKRYLLKKYNYLAIAIISIAILYIVIDFYEWFNLKNEFVFGYGNMPYHRRILTNLYMILYGYGGYKLFKLKKASWYMLIISMTSIIPSFFIIPRIWGTIYYTNWFEDLPLLLWYLLSIVLACFLVINRNDFGVNRWLSKVFLILIINIVIRYLHELILYSVATN